MKKHCTALALLFMVAGLNAQVIFQRTYALSGADHYECYVRQLNDGGYIIASSTTTVFGGDKDFYLLRTDSNGDTLWTKKYGTPAHDAVEGLDLTRDGGFIISGESGSGNYTDGYLVRTDSLGDTLWTRQYGGPEAEEARCVRSTLDGGFVFTGLTTSYDVGIYDYYVVKVDSTGAIAWTKVLGTSGQDYAMGIAQTSDSGFVFTGGSHTGWVGTFRTDKNGNVIWNKDYGNSGYAEGWGIAQTQDGGYIITGTTNSGVGEFYLIRTDNAGDTLWTRVLSNAGGCGKAVLETAEGDFVVAGGANTLGEAVLIKFDPNGNVIWAKSYGGLYTYGYSLDRTNDGGYVIGAITNNSGAGNESLLVIKTDSMGHSGCNEATLAVAVYPYQTVSYVQVTSEGSGGAAVPVATVVTNGTATISTIPCTTVGLDPVQPASGENLFPVPASDYLTIQLQENFPGSCRIRLYSMTGQLVQETVSSEPLVTLDLRKKVLPGIYIVEVTDDSGKVLMHRKAIVE